MDFGDDTDWKSAFTPLTGFHDLISERRVLPRFGGIDTDHENVCFLGQATDLSAKLSQPRARNLFGNQN